jgi:hypothetical protein
MLASLPEGAYLYLLEKPMTEDKVLEDEPLASVQEVEVVGSIDWFLRSTVETIIAHGVEIGVTLAVGGAIVSGVLISGKKYFEELGDALNAASETEGDIQSVLGDSWRQFTTIYDKPEGAPDDWQAPSAAYLHLRGARYYAPGQRPIPAEGALWRGKLSAVDAFSVGQFRES